MYRLRKLLLAAVMAGVSAGFSVYAEESYKTPPESVVDSLKSAPPVNAVVSPDTAWLVVEHKLSMPSISSRAVPSFQLAGVSINGLTNGLYEESEWWMPYQADTERLSLLQLNSGRSVDIGPVRGRLGSVAWSPDSRKILFLQTENSGISAWVFEVESEQLTLISKSNVNGARSAFPVADAPCMWMPNSEGVLCHLVPENRGVVPSQSPPVGPFVERSQNSSAPIRTYTNLLESEYEAELFDHFMESVPTVIDIESADQRSVGDVAIYEKFKPSPDGSRFLAIKIVKPYSSAVPVDRFPKIVEILNEVGETASTVAETGEDLSSESLLGGAPEGFRVFDWVPGSKASLTFIESLDGGNPDLDAEYRDRLLLAQPPFYNEPVEIIRTKSRITNNYWDNEYTRYLNNGRQALITEFSWDSRTRGVWLVDLIDSEDRAAPKQLWEHSTDDWYGHPGWPLAIDDGLGNQIVQQDGERMFVTSPGGSPKGDFPRLSMLDLVTGETEEVFRSQSGLYEEVLAVLDARDIALLTRYQSSTVPPNYRVVDAENNERRQLGSVSTNSAESVVMRSTKKRIEYQRSDGLPLSGDLYLPPGYEPGDKVPVLVWAYPTEYASTSGAGQIRGSLNIFSGSTTSYTDHLLLLANGYAVLDSTSMPITGGITANDSFVDQVVMNAEAAVSALVDLGVTRKEWVAVGGHSYGAFMAANLLAHSDLFFAGVAQSGAYNRTLTPFGFQYERRTFWDSPEVYFEMSPFVHADKIDEPLLLIHGAMDPNSGTYPIQSERLFDAINGLGGRVKLVKMPYEVHYYIAEESRLHIIAEMIEWFDTNLPATNSPSNLTNGE